MKREPTRAILEATLRLVARGGVDAVRYRDVAAEADVPLGTVSYRYPNREDLIRAAFTFFLADNAASLLAHRSRSALATLDDIAAFIAEVVRADFADSRRPYLAEYELVVYAGRDPAIAEALVAWDRETVGELARMLERVGVPAPIAAAQTLVDLLRGFQLANLGRKDRDVADFRARVTHVLHALAAQPASPSPLDRPPRRSPSSRRTRASHGRRTQPR
ncbi:MAG TPA: TetR family transcriptional regulator [Kofleriaceae bacterium]